MTHEIKQNQTLEWIRKYWVIIVFVFMSFAAWVTLTNKVEGHSDEIKVLKASDVQSASANNQILVELSAIRTDLLWLKANINK